MGNDEVVAHFIFEQVTAIHGKKQLKANNMLQLIARENLNFLEVLTF